MGKCKGNQLHYPLDSGLSSGQHYPSLEQLGPEGQNHSEQLFLQVLFYAFRSLLTLLKGMIVISTARHVR